MVTVAAIQAEAFPGEAARNVEAAARWVGRAAEAGAEVVLFPEAFVTGYDARAFASPLPRVDDVTLFAPLQQAVDATSALVVLNTALAGPDGPQPTATLSDLILAPFKPPVAAYAKQHLYAEEERFFVAGTRSGALEVNGARLGLAVCHDASFPDHAAEAAAQGAEAYLCSGAFFPGGQQRCEEQMAARARDNGIYVVFAGLIGAPSDFIGATAIYDPCGRIVAGVEDGEGMAVATIDADVKLA